MSMKSSIDGVVNIKSYDIIQINYEKRDKSDTKADWRCYWNNIN